MIYIFGFDSYFKMGYARCPWLRAEGGFWCNIHPRALCGKLADAELLCAFEGDEPLERALHSILVPDACEFYAMSRLDDVLSFLALALEPLPLPSRPTRPPMPPTPSMPPPSTQGLDRRRPCEMIVSAEPH